MVYKIKDLPLEEKPREKSKIYGFSSLTNAELLAILLRSGTKEKNVLELAIEVLKELDNLKGISNLRISSLANIKGVGEVKAITLLAAIELGKRINNPLVIEKFKIKETKDVYNHYKHYLEKETQEKFLVLFLNNQNEVIAQKTMYIGSSSGSIVEPREVFKEAMLHHATRLIVLHNHPSGHVTPSKEDYNITDKLKQIGELLNISLLDHLIIGNNNYFSFYTYLRKENKNE